MGIDATARLYIGFEVDPKHLKQYAEKINYEGDIDMGNGWFISNVYPYNDCNLNDVHYYIHYKIIGKKRHYYQNEQIAAASLDVDIVAARKSWTSMKDKCAELNIPIDWDNTILQVMAVANVC